MTFAKLYDYLLGLSALAGDMLLGPGTNAAAQKNKLTQNEVLAVKLLQLQSPHRG